MSGDDGHSILVIFVRVAIFVSRAFDDCPVCGEEADNSDEQGVDDPQADFHEPRHPQH